MSNSIKKNLWRNMNGMVIVFDSKKLNFECIDSMIIVQCFFQTADSNFNRMACAAFFDIFFQLIIVRQHLYAVKCVRLKFSVKSKVFCQKNGSFEISAPFFFAQFQQIFLFLSFPSIALAEFLDIFLPFDRMQWLPRTICRTIECKESFFLHGIVCSRSS